MKKHNIIQVIVISLLIISLLPATIFAQRKYAPYNFYPQEYSEYTANNWQEMRQILDGFLAYETAGQIRESEKPHEARFILSRMVDIDWGNLQQGEIATYLKNFVETLLEGKGFLPELSLVEVSRGLSKYDPVFLPQRTIWALFMIDEDAGCRLIEETWTKFASQTGEYADNLRFFTLWTMENNYKSNQVINCIEEIEKIADGELSTDDINQIDKIKIKHKLSTMQDQSGAWDFLWDQSGTSSASEVLTTSNKQEWYDYVLYMKDVYGEPDVNVLIGKVENTTNVAKKYVFMFGTCFLLNTALSQSANEESKVQAIKAKKLAEDLYRENLVEVIGGQESNDFLDVTLESMKSLMDK